MTSPADTIRRAAAFARLVAEANTAISENRPIPKEMQGRTRAEIVRADMHPAVGRGLAAWLELEADVIAARTATDGSGEYAVDISGDHALAVARAVLGGDDQ